MNIFRGSFPVRLFLLAAAMLSLMPVASFAQARGATATTRGGAISEAALAAEVNHELVMLSRYTIFDHIEYKVNDSDVTLTGQVTSDTLKRDAENRVKNIEGVTTVTNNLEILPAAPADDRIRRATYRAIFSDPALEIYSHGAVQPLHIIVKNGHVTLVGAVLNAGHKQLAETRAKSVSGVFSVTNNLRVETSRTE
jgi:osmotically-inducible protein OsmY